MDECQDWVFVSSEEVDGNVEVVVNRLLDTKDQQDRPMYATRLCARVFLCVCV